MRSHAKASSAAPTQRQATGLGRIVRGAFAIRGGSIGADGSGAPSARGKLALLSLTALALTGLALLVSSAFASKEVTNWFGNASNSGSKGGEFSNPRDVAVNRTGAGGVPAGTIYVADDGNNRVQRFSPSGEFVSAWGANVQTPSVNEVQTVTVNATAGTYILSLGGATTAPLAYNASSSAIQTALRGLSSVGGTNLSVSGTAPYTVTFNNALSATNVAQLSADDSALTGTVSTATTTQGSGRYEICTVAEECLRGAATGGANLSGTAKNGALSSPQSVAVDNDTGNVYVSDRSNFRVNEYTAEGTFVRSFGWGVDADTAGSEYEVCPAADRCTFGVAGAGAGQVGSTGTTGTLGIAVSQPDGEAAVGTVFLADSQNRRVDTFALDGTGAASFGSSANFEATQPRKIAVDSRGVVYASNSKNQGEIERYDSADANGGGTVFLAPITAANSSPAGPLLAGSAATATSGLAVHADSDGGGADTDVLYVLRDPSSGPTVVQQFGTTNQPGLTAAPTAVDDTHGAGAGFSSVNGLGLDDSSGRLFVTATNNVSGLPSGSRVYVLGELPAPSATLDPITEYDAHAATFSGSVNPEGAETAYRFEYVDDADFGATGFENALRRPLADVNLGHGESPVSVEAEIPDLVAGTTYHVRLLAKRFFGGAETIAGPFTFTTESSAPTIDGVGATVSGEEKATLRAAIDPENETVSAYHFEWGADTSYGNSTPAGGLSSGSEPVAVEEPLTGLTPGQTYHYRLLATNATGTTTGSDQSFTTPAGPPQLPQRGYEVVSPLPSGGVPMLPGFGAVNPNEDGTRVVFNATQPLPGSTAPIPEMNLAGAMYGSYWIYESVRGTTGWELRQTGLATASVGGLGYSISGDARRMLLTTNVGLDPADQNGEDDVYMRNPDGTFTWISRDPRIPAGTPQTAPGGAVIPPNEVKYSSFGGGEGPAISADGSTVVFYTDRPLLDTDTIPPPPAPPAAPIYRLYKWHEGKLTFLGERPDGSVATRGSTLSMAGSSGGMVNGAISRDGSRVLVGAGRDDSVSTASRGFLSTAGYTLYVHTDGQPTVDALKEEGVPPIPTSQLWDPTFRGASADDSRVFYTTEARLTRDSGAQNTNGGAEDLYLYDINPNKVRDLTPRLDGIEDPEAGPAASDRGDAMGLSAVSEDGERFYFVAKGAYDVAPSPEGQLPAAGSSNLYMGELNSFGEPLKLRFVTTLGAGDGAVWQRRWSGKAAESSPDGSVLAFGSSADLVGGHPTGGTEQMYVYDAKTDTLSCASCPTDGSLPAGDVEVGLAFEGGSIGFRWQAEYGEKHWVTDDGTVFFDTPTTLLPSDRNNAADVYEYREGELRLISAGTGNALAKFEGASPEGHSVFFTTSEALTPQDSEPGTYKLYDARIGGGFPYSPPTPACDLNAGACEKAGTSAGRTTGAGTAAFKGPGNPKPKRISGCPKGRRKVHRKGRVRCVKRHHHKKRHHHRRGAKHNRRAGR